MTRQDLAFRAADYFGMAREPRTSIKLGRWKCAVVAKRGGGTALALYDEQHRAKGDYVLLTDEQRDALVEALS